MGKLAVNFLICMSLQCVWSYYSYSNAQPYQTKIIYRHHIATYQPRATFMRPMHVPPLPPAPYAPMPVIPYAPPALPFHAGAATPVSYFMPKPPPLHHMFNHIPFAPAASHQNSYFSNTPAMPPPPPPVPKYRIKDFFTNSLQGAFSNYPSKPSIFNKIKPYLFGNQGPRSLPHHPYYPDYFPPHHFTPNRPFQNRPSAHMAFPVHQPSPPIMHHATAMMNPENSCSCSLHVGQLTVYKHTDVRSSYSCTDIKDCNAFCTNLFSSEDLRAQTRADACLIIGKDTTVPWFRRDHACEPGGVKNDTDLSVDLCCKNLQPC